MSATTNNISSQDYTNWEDQPTTNGDRIPIDVDPGVVHVASLNFLNSIENFVFCYIYILGQIKKIADFSSAPAFQNSRRINFFLFFEL